MSHLRYWQFFLIDNLGTIILIFALISAVGQAAFYFFKQWPMDLKGIIQKTLAGAGFVSGLALIVCAFDTNLLQKITNLEIYILISGISILYVSYIGLFPDKQKN